MKKICVISLIIIIVIMGILFGKNIFHKKNDNLEVKNNYKNIQELNVISQYNDYLLVSSDSFSELQTYSIYKNVYGDNFKELFSLPDGESIESRFVYWLNDKLYVLGNNPASYSLSDGKMANTGDLNKILGGTTGRIDKIMGTDKNYIYYTFSYNADVFYGKISFDLSNVTLIQKNDIPKEINN